MHLLLVCRLFLLRYLLLPIFVSFLFLIFGGFFLCTSRVNPSAATATATLHHAITVSLSLSNYVPNSCCVGAIGAVR